MKAAQACHHGQDGAFSLLSEQSQSVVVCKEKQPSHNAAFVYEPSSTIGRCEGFQSPRQRENFGKLRTQASSTLSLGQGRNLSRGRSSFLKEPGALSSDAGGTSSSEPTVLLRLEKLRLDLLDIMADEGSSIAQMFSSIDQDGNRVLTMAEFVQALELLDVPQHDDTALCGAFFDAMDTDSSGAVDLDELRRRLRKPLTRFKPRRPRYLSGKPANKLLRAAAAEADAAQKLERMDRQQQANRSTCKVKEYSWGKEGTSALPPEGREYVEILKQTLNLCTGLKGEAVGRSLARIRKLPTLQNSRESYVAASTNDVKRGTRCFDAGSPTDRHPRNLPRLDIHGGRGVVAFSEAASANDNANGEQKMLNELLL